MIEQLKASMIRIYQNDREEIPLGLGFLVHDMYVLTCAHVVVQVLGLKDVSEIPNQSIHLDFPFVSVDKIVTAHVVCWQPKYEDDIAVLKLHSFPPSNARPARLVTANDLWGHSFRAFGFPNDYNKGVWATGVMRDHHVGGRLQIEAVNMPGHRIVQGFSGTPVWDEQLDGIVGMVVESDIQAATKTAYIIPSTSLIKAWPNLNEQAIPPSPYRGLSFFREIDAHNFFGREAYIEQIVDAVHKRPLMAVIGPSGSGKSSVVFAGLVPRLRQEENWLVATFRPGTFPFRSLAAALVPLLEPQMSETDRLIENNKLATRLLSKEIALNDVIERIVQNHFGKRLLLIVDQFEELFTLSTSMDEQLQFLDTLLCLSQPEYHRHPSICNLVITMRADFLGNAVSYRPFADALQHNDLKLGPMTHLELFDAIRRPAENLKVHIDEGLVERILGDISREPGNLPLIEFILTLLWKRQWNKKITIASYEEIGGVEHSIATYADDIYNGLDEEKQEQAHHIFVQLVHPGEGQEDTRRLATRAEIGEERRELISILSNARLVISGRDYSSGDDTVEIVHEALIQKWGRLRKWIESDREFRLWQERLRMRLSEWKRTNKHQSELLQEHALVEAEVWLKERSENLGQIERDYIHTSLEQQRKIQRDREEARANELALRATYQRMDEFLGIVSHELRTPLVTIKGNVQLARLRLRTSLREVPASMDVLRSMLEEIQMMLERAERQTNVQNRMVSDLLDITRLQADKLELRLVPCDLAPIVQEMVEDQRSTTPKRAISLEIPKGETAPVIADPDRIGQVMNNYLTNALKFSQEGRPIVVRLQKRGKKVRVSVHDQGPGLTPAEQEHIWDRFYQVEGIKRQRGSSAGLGLGLYISRAIIEQHQGEVGVESIEGEGSIFWFSLLLIDEAEAHELKDEHSISN